MTHVRLAGNRLMTAKSNTFVFFFPDIYVRLSTLKRMEPTEYEGNPLGIHSAFV